MVKRRVLMCYAASHCASHSFSFVGSPFGLVDCATDRVGRYVSVYRFCSLGKAASRPDPDGTGRSAPARPACHHHRLLRNHGSRGTAYLKSRPGRGVRADTTARRALSGQRSSRTTGYYHYGSASNSLAIEGRHSNRFPHGHNWRDGRCEDLRSMDAAATSRDRLKEMSFAHDDESIFFNLQSFINEARVKLAPSFRIL